MAKQKSADPPHMHVKQIVSLPGPGDAFGGTTNAWYFSPTNVWAQGSNLTGSVDGQLQQVTQHFDGKKWTTYPLPSQSYGAIVSSSPTSAWAEGVETTLGHYGYTTGISYLDHFDGNVWTHVTSGGNRVFDVGAMATVGNDFWYLSWGSSDTQERRQYLHHYNPSTGWNEMKTVGLPVKEPIFRLVALSPFNMWATTQDNQVFHYTGQIWHETPLQALDDIRGISVVSSTNVWIHGIALDGKAIVEHWNGLQWQTIPLAPYPPGSTHDGVKDEILEVFAFSRSDIWTLTSVHALSEQSLLSFFEHWDGRTWTLYTAPHCLAQYPIALLWKEHALGAVLGDATSQELVALRE